MWKIGGSVKLTWDMIRLYVSCYAWICYCKDSQHLQLFCFLLVSKAMGLMVLCLHLSMRAGTRLINPTMHLSHILQCTIQNKNVHISVLNGVLWDMGQMHRGICEFDPDNAYWYSLHRLDISSYDIDYIGYTCRCLSSMRKELNILCHHNVWKYNAGIFLRNCCIKGHLEKKLPPKKTSKF